MAHDRVVVEKWLDSETGRLLKTVDAMRHRDLHEPSTLPDWSLGQLLTHIARNADALCNLLLWAQTGVETPMYTSAQQRNDDIDRGALRSSALIIDDVAATAEKFDAARQNLLPEQWEQPVRTAHGRTIPAAKVPWLRLREVVIHHVDLGARFEDVDDALVFELLHDVTATLRGKPEWPSIALTTTDGATLVADGNPTVTGTSAQLLGWLTGRSHGGELASSGSIPALPAWL